MPSLFANPPVAGRSFGDALVEFDGKMRNQDRLPRSIVPINGQMQNDITLRGATGQPLEEYYKWQFLYALIHSGLYPKTTSAQKFGFLRETKVPTHFRLMPPFLTMQTG
jgi:hypothetical protein